MIPPGPLMKEHRLIEKMILILEKGIPVIEKNGTFQASFIEKTVDFFRMYADRTHHGKEENIFFRKLAEKKMQPEHKAIMDQLIQEHIFARTQVKSLEKAAADKNLKEVIAHLRTLTGFYPPHIEKEDKRFFLPVMIYLTEQEKNSILEDFETFDSTLIHEKYNQIITTFPAPAL